MSILSCWKYFKGIFRHKFWVFIYCVKLKTPLRVALFHDMSKYSFKEFFVYVDNFYNKDGTKKKVRDSNGAYDTNLQSDKFKSGWINHQRNKHHWQAWCNIGDKGIITAIDMPEVYIREMIADWCGAQRQEKGEPIPLTWYSKNKQNMVLTDNSDRLIQKVILDNFEK